MADEKEKKEPADNRPEFFWNYLTKTMRLKLDKWTKMITTNEFRKKDERTNQTNVKDYSSHEPKFGGTRGVNLVFEPLDKAQVVVVHAV
ncbi:GM16562 [Drosophila sechellia]|uniref:GM16562 n=1 Tax=Drosophila sechellia TaxID=7238 RepID=B4IN28_DROSE|nr:GM16562 [Drosophila sechellia]